MTDEKVAAVLSGSIGWFWPADIKPRDINEDPERGYLRLLPTNLIELTSLDEDPFESRKSSALRRPRLITGATENGGVLILNITGRSTKTTMGGSIASVRSYRAQSVLVGVTIDHVLSEKLTSVSAHFFGLSPWLGVSAVSEKALTTEKSRLKAFEVRVESSPEQVVKISRGREVAISAYWNTAGSRDRRTIYAPGQIQCRSVRPKTLWELREPILRIQDLMSWCFGGFIRSESGLAEPDLSEEPDATPRLWDKNLMTVPGAVAEAKDKGFPILQLSDIGGIRALGRWLSLCDKHLRAVRPLIEPFRQGKASPPLRMLEVASAMEYWVATHRRTTQWAKAKCLLPKHNGCGYAWTLANHVGDTFGQWVGDRDAWAHSFWETYNKLKHEPGYVIDEYKLSVLADTGALLLAAELLSRVAGNKEPARALFTDTSHTWQLQRQVQQLLNESEPTAGKSRASR
ncbi:HEPN domain-containing protein [Micromonospora taraxaci]|uniref:ApeA N-terminal domain 1-containing protein n=1 Tax=Micromonospora taraxaci TaxID=1316803 RepID=UPI0033C0E304